MSSDPLKRARGLAYRLLARRARTVKEIRDNFKRKEIPAEVSTQIIDELLAAGYLNDFAYAQQYIEYHVTNKQHGPLWLRASLQRAGIERELISRALSAVFLPGCEEALAEQYLTKLCARADLSPQKAMRSLLSRGFTTQAARQAAAKVIDFQEF
ncbi:MAG TPA: RecX family transcriptional regulator [Oscillospiraceae bacterium]|nr:RecX family transcriptional regulator [Oscillospiraceae bacterium]